MTGEELRTLNTNILSGKSMDSDLFYQLLNIAKNRREMMRDWAKLRTLSNSITFSASDTYLTGKTLPDRFLRIYTAFDRDTGASNGVFIVTTDGSQLFLKPIKQAEAYAYRNTQGYYYIDSKNGTICRTGNTSGTLYMYYLQGTVDVDAQSTEIWDFPSYSDALLAFDVAIDQKGGIDWDTVNANQVPYNQRKLQQIEMNLATWDAQMQQAELGV